MNITQELGLLVQVEEIVSRRIIKSYLFIAFFSLKR